MADQDRGTRLVQIDDLRRCLAVAFEHLQLTRENAEGLSALLVDSELRGHPDHGVAALGVLAGFYRDGTLNPRPSVRVLHETDGAILFDGDRGSGPGVPTRAMRWCIERARERKGMAVAAIRDWQLLVAAPYARLAAEAGLIGFACTNFVPLVAPPGGRTAVFGTNPFAYGLPAQHHHPVVLDVATTVSSMQRVRIAAQHGTLMPEGVIFDHAGRPTTDPKAFLKGGLLAPLGFPHAPHKGFGLALFIDALSGVLSGAGFAQGVATARQGTSSGPSTSRRSCPGRSSCSGWMHSSTRSSKASGYPVSMSCYSPASAASDATWTSPPAASCRWHRRAGSCWQRAASRWASHCRLSSITDAWPAATPAHIAQRRSGSTTVSASRSARRKRAV
jgi:LDH2 family malate/lactate/ureidoglycolate dehydrogenase